LIFLGQLFLNFPWIFFKAIFSPFNSTLTHGILRLPFFKHFLRTAPNFLTKLEDLVLMNQIKRSKQCFHTCFDLSKNEMKESSYFIVYFERQKTIKLPCLMLWHRNEGGDQNGRRRMCERWSKIPVKTFWTVYWWEVGTLYTKSKGENGSRWSDHEISDLLEEVEILDWEAGV